jgi:hypothetical protein
MNYIFRSKLGSEGYELKIGLWQSCETDPNIGQVCVGITCPQQDDTTNICSRLLAARAFVTLACIISGFSALLLFACVATGDNTRRILLIAGKALAFVCLVMGIIGIAVGINVTTDTNGEFGIQLSWGASAIIGVIAIVLNFFGAIVSVLIK